MQSATSNLLIQYIKRLLRCTTNRGWLWRLKAEDCTWQNQRTQTGAENTHNCKLWTQLRFVTFVHLLTLFTFLFIHYSLLMNLNCFVFSLIEQMCCLLNNLKMTPLKSVLKFIFTAYERKVNESITTFFMFMWWNQKYTLYCSLYLLTDVNLQLYISLYEAWWYSAEAGVIYNTALISYRNHTANLFLALSLKYLFLLL